MKIDENRIREIVAESLKALSEETNGSKKKHKNSKQIESYFKKKGVNCAPYAYKLFHVKAKEGKDSIEMKNARGLFMKKLNHETNEYGNPYKFTSGELNRLQSLISNAQLSEAVDKAFDTVLNEGLEEGWFNNAVNTVKGAVQGAQMGYNQAKYTDQANGNLNNNGSANSTFEKMIASVKNSQDAATVYASLMRTAALYAGQAKQLRAKMKEIGAAHDVQRTQNRQGGKFAAGFAEKDKGTSTGVNLDRSTQNNMRQSQGDAMNFGKNTFSAGGAGGLGTNRRSGSYFTRRFNEAVENAIYETLIEEGLWSNLKSAWKGMKQGAQMQRALGSDAKADYANGAEAAKSSIMGDYTDTRKDATASIQKYAEMAKEFDGIAAQLRAQAKALAQKWNIVRSNVGQAGPAQYGYSKKQPQAQPGVANNPAPAQTSSQLAEMGDLDEVAPEDEMGSHPVMGSVS